MREDKQKVLAIYQQIDARIYGFRNTWRMKIEMHFEKRGDNWYPVTAIATSN